MRNLSVLFIIVGILFLSSCKKDNSVSNPNNGSQPKSFTEDVRSSVIGNSLITYDLSYDANGRLTALTARSTPPLLNFIYTYLAANKVTLDLYQSGSLNIHEIMWLNASSYLDTTFQYNDTGDTTTEKYIYNGNKQLIQLNNYDYSTTGTSLNNVTNYTYDNLGNVTTSADNQGQTISYTYYTNLPNTLKIGQTFLPQAINFVKTEVLNTGGTITTSNHFYTFDNSNRVIKDSSYTAEVDLITIKSYTY